MIKAQSEYNKDQKCIACSIEVNGRGDITLEEMCGIVKAFMNAHLQNAIPGHELAVSIMIGEKIVDTVAQASKDFMRMQETSQETS